MSTTAVAPKPDPTLVNTDKGDSKRKRKREKEKANKLLKKPKPSTNSATSTTTPTTTSKPNSNTKPKPKLKSKPKNAPTTKELIPAKPLTAEDERVNEDISRMDPKLLADYVASRTRKFQKELSLIELEDLLIPERAFLDTVSFPHPRNLAHLPTYLETYAKDSHDVSRAPEAAGTPHTLVVAAAALRATHLARAVKTFQSKESLVAKLFAKHIKLAESIEFCQSTRIGIGVGTPGRILDLLKEGALKVDGLRQIVVDVSHVDAKSFGIFDIRETQKAVVEMLGWGPVRGRLVAGETKVLFF